MELFFSLCDFLEVVVAVDETVANFSLLFQHLWMLVSSELCLHIHQSDILIPATEKVPKAQRSHHLLENVFSQTRCYENWFPAHQPRKTKHLG